MSEPAASEPKQGRRSERLCLTVPVRVFGLDPNGRQFCEDALTVSINRHGARIRLENPLVVDDEIVVTNLSNNQEDQFRVVGQVSKPQGDNPFSDWGVECLHPEKSIWGIDFQDSPEDAEAASALLECCACSTVISVQLTYEEVDTLSQSKLVTRPCANCRQGTFWKVTTPDRRQPKPPAVEQALAAAGLPQESPGPVFTPAPLAPPSLDSAPPAGEERRLGEDRRQERRVALRVPIRIRTPDGSIEVAKTENLSKTGARFVGEKDYPVGTTLFVAAPYTAGEEPFETQAVVEQADDLPGSTGKIYGIKFAIKPVTC